MLATKTKQCKFQLIGIQKGFKNDILVLLILSQSTIFETIYSLAESKPDWRWQLTASGRFAHRKEYIASIGRQHGLKVVHYEPLEGFRHELGKDVRGHAFLMQKDVVNDEL